MITYEKYCNGCKRWLPFEKFGVRTGTRSKLSTRCMECNAEYTRKYYNENFDRISERKKIYYDRNHPPKQKHIFIKLDVRQDPDSILRKCPHCNSLVSIWPEQTEGFCHKKEKKYLVKRHLSGLKLEAEFEKRNYEEEILNYIKLKGKTYIAEISDAVNISEGKVSGVVRDLISNNILMVVKTGKCKWVAMSGE